MQNVTAVKRPAITYSCVVFCKLLYLRNIINTGRAEENLANCYRCGESWKLFHPTKVLQSLTTVLCSAVVMAERGLQTITIVEIHAKGYRYWKSCKLIQPWRALQTFLRLQRDKLIRLWIVLQTFTAVESLAIFLTIVESGNLLQLWNVLQAPEETCKNHRRETLSKLIQKWSVLENVMA